MLWQREWIVHYTYLISTQKTVASAPTRRVSSENTALTSAVSASVRSLPRLASTRCVLCHPDYIFMAELNDCFLIRLDEPFRILVTFIYCTTSLFLMHVQTGLAFVCVL